MALRQRRVGMVAEHLVLVDDFALVHRGGMAAWLLGGMAGMAYAWPWHLRCLAAWRCCGGIVAVAALP